MELSKITEITNSLSDKIKTAYKKDIDKIIDILIQEYDICKRDTNEQITKNELKSIFFKNYEIKYCSAVTKNGLQCKHKVLNDSLYCNKHIYSMQNFKNFIHKNYETESQNQEIQNDNKNLIFIQENDKNVTECKINKRNLKNVLIENEFYLIDEKWIYDKNTMEKMGYIENNEYILTSDPFIIGNL